MFANISWSPCRVQTTALCCLGVNACPCSLSHTDPFGKGLLKGSTAGCNPSCIASKDHLIQAMSGPHVPSTEQLFGKAHSKKWRDKLCSWLRRQPQFQHSRLSLVWNSTPSAWRKSGIVDSFCCTDLLTRPCLLSRQIGWPKSLSSSLFSTSNQKSFNLSKPNIVWNCSGWWWARSEKSMWGRKRLASSTEWRLVLGSITSTWMLTGGVIWMSAQKVAITSLWALPASSPQLPQPAMETSSGWLAPSRRAMCASCWMRDALRCPCDQSDSSKCANAL